MLRSPRTGIDRYSLTYRLPVFLFPTGIGSNRGTMQIRKISIDDIPIQFVYTGKQDFIVRINPDMVMRQPAEGEFLSSAETILQDQQKAIQIYPEYILEMPDRARAAALLSGGGADGYSMRNIEKTTRDFEGLETLPIRPDREMALLALYQSSMSDILVIVFLLFVCVRLFSREYENRLYPLLLATPGRFRVAVHKLTVLAGSAVLITAAIYGTNLCIGGFLMGYGDLSRPIQSLGDFRSCCLRISCLDYIWIGYLIKLFTVLVFGLLILALFVLLKKAVTVFLICAAFLGASYGLYAAIPVTSSLNFLHFVNFFYFIDSYSVLSRYQNISVVGFPVSMTTVLPIVLAVLLVACVVLVLLRFSTGSVCRGVRILPIVARALDWVNLMVDRVNHHEFLFLHELRKAMISGRGLVLLLALGLLLWNNWNTAFRFVSILTTDPMNQARKKYYAGALPALCMTVRYIRLMKILLSLSILLRFATQLMWVLRENSVI